jgi:hypothetical protein
MTVQQPRGAVRRAVQQPRGAVASSACAGHRVWGEADGAAGEERVSLYGEEGQSASLRAARVVTRACGVFVRFTCAFARMVEVNTFQVVANGTQVVQALALLLIHVGAAECRAGARKGEKHHWLAQRGRKSRTLVALSLKQLVSRMPL